MSLLIGMHFVGVINLSFFDPLVIVLQLTHKIFEAVLVLNEGVAGQRDIETVGFGFDLVHHSLEVLS